MRKNWANVRQKHEPGRRNQEEKNSAHRGISRNGIDAAMTRPIETLERQVKGMS